MWFEFALKFSFISRENKARTEKHISLLKSLYDYSKLKNVIQNSSNTPRSLYVDDIDEEQLWQQLELEVSKKWVLWFDSESDFYIIDAFPSLE